MASVTCARPGGTRGRHRWGPRGEPISDPSRVALGPRGRPFAGRAWPGSSGWSGPVSGGLPESGHQGTGWWSSERPRHRAPVGPGGAAACAAHRGGRVTGGGDGADGVHHTAVRAIALEPRPSARNAVHPRSGDRLAEVESGPLGLLRICAPIVMSWSFCASARASIAVYVRFGRRVPFRARRFSETVSDPFGAC